MRESKGRMGMGALIAATLMMAQMVQARPGVRISAEVLRPENNNAPVTVIVRDEDGDTLWKHTTQATHYEMKLPSDRMYTIAFSQPDCIEKEVVIDARHKQPSGTRMKLRKVSFLVVLEPDHGTDLRYAGPVGRIGFEDHSGRLLVDRRYVLVGDMKR